MASVDGPLAFREPARESLLVRQRGSEEAVSAHTRHPVGVEREAGHLLLLRAKETRTAERGHLLDEATKGEQVGNQLLHNAGSQEEHVFQKQVLERK